MDDASIAPRQNLIQFDVNRSYTNDGRLNARDLDIIATHSAAHVTTAVLSVPELQQQSIIKKNTSSSVPLVKNWQYRKERIIGAGADGKVYLAVDLRSQEPIAVKEILISTSTNRTLRQAQEDSKKINLMKKQIDALRMLSPHANVVHHLGAERSTCALNVMMEYVAGGSISSVLSKLGAFDEKAVRVYARHICSALEFLHNAGVIHRDIKGANCLVGLDGVTKVADFGCCIIQSLQQDQGEKGIHGTSMWMSPESIQAMPVTDRADIWSLACTVIEMATGKPPWAEAHFTNEWAAMFYISQSKRGPPIPPQLSRQAHSFLLRCFAIDPQQRPSATECLKHPFLAEDFDPESSDRELKPPTPTETDHCFPRAPTTNSEDLSSTDYATSTYSSVYDPAWGDAEAMEEDGYDQLEQQQFMDPAVAASASAETAQESGLTRGIAVSQEAIDTYIRGTGAASPRPLTGAGRDGRLSGGSATGLPLQSVADDEHGFGLSEPVLFAVFSMLDHIDLCSLGMVSHNIRELIETGAKEFLWRNLFLHTFGEVDVVRMTLRKSWKSYYEMSLKNQAIVLDDWCIQRQLCQSVNVFEGRDKKTDEPVVIKLEKWNQHSTPQKSRGVCLNVAQLGLRGDVTMSPIRGDRTTSSGQSAGLSPMNNSSAPHPQRTPGKPLKGRSGVPGLSVLSPGRKREIGGITESISVKPPFTPHQHQTNRTSIVSVVGTVASPTKGGKVVQIVQPHTAPVQSTFGSTASNSSSSNNLSGNVQRGKILPRSKGIHTPTTVNRVLNPTSPGDLQDTGKPHQFVFLQPSQFLKDLQSSSPQSKEASTNGASSNQGGQGSDASTSFNSTLRENLSRTGTWHDIYEFPRSNDLIPLASKPTTQKSLLQHHFKILRHLEALGTRCIPRLISFKDADNVLACNVLVTSKVGPSLNELLAFCGNQLTLRSICLLGIRLLDAVEELHLRDVVHSAITPTNIAMGINDQQGQLFLINFSQGRFFRDPRTHRPVAAFTTPTVERSARKQNEYLSFCSTFIQRNCTPAPRDDVIAIGYVLCYLFYGGLPWIKETKQFNSSEVIRQKTTYLDGLMRSPPLQLHYFLKSGYACRQGDVPDFVYLKGLIKRLMVDKKWADDGQFDWTPRLEESASD